MAYGRMAAIYDRLMADMPYDRWVDLFAAFSGRMQEPVRHVADLGCGTGAVSIRLAKRGLRVTGIDLSEEMLSVAQARSAGLDAAVAGRLQWLCQDMAEWDVGEPVDAAVSLCDCINYLPDERAVEAAIKITYANLKPGGLWLFDMLTSRQFEAYEAAQPFYLNEDDLAYIWTCDWQPDERCIEHEITFFAQAEDGRFERFDESHRQRAYDPGHVMRLLREAGFVEIEAFADFRTDRPVEGADRAFFAAFKPPHAG